MSDDLIKVPLVVSKGQFLKMKRGLPVQFSHKALSTHKHHLMLHHENHRKVQKALKERKGVRLHISQHEFENSGEGLWDFIKDSANWVKNHVIDTDAYQKYVKPIVKSAVQQGVNALSSVAGLNDTDKAKLQSGADWVGEKTAAFGLKGKKKRVLKTSNNQSNLLSSSNHPAMFPPSSTLRPPAEGSGARCPHCGGSFRLA